MIENSSMPETAKIQEIINLHEQIEGHLRLSLDKGIKIGQLLSEQKKRLGSENFTAWINGYLPFTDKTAKNYMRCNLLAEASKILQEETETLTLSQLMNIVTLADLIEKQACEIKLDAAWHLGEILNKGANNKPC